MLSIILVSPDAKKREKYLQEHHFSLGIQPLDITVISKDTDTKQNQNSIGIETIKDLQKKLYLKPIKSQLKAITLNEAHLLTIEAQNACLKILEEPPEDTLITLSTDTTSFFLPTILSRCQIIELNITPTTHTEKELKEINTFIENISNIPLGTKLKKAETLAKDKEKTLIFIKTLILYLRAKLLESINAKTTQNLLIPKNPNLTQKDLLKLIKNLQSLHTTLTNTNTNPRFAIEHALLAI